MARPFKDPIAVKDKKSDYSFVSPSKEEATTGRFMPPGDDYGVGYRTPVGKFKASNTVDTLPMKSKCLKPDDAVNVI